MSGDYSKAHKYASEYKGSNYGGYNLLTNNCLHYVHDVLNYAKYGDKTWYYEKLNTIVPSKYAPKSITKTINEKISSSYKSYICLSD